MISKSSFLLDSLLEKYHLIWPRASAAGKSRQTLEKAARTETKAFRVIPKAHARGGDDCGMLRVAVGLLRVQGGDEAAGTWRSVSWSHSDAIEFIELGGCAPGKEWEAG